MSDALKFTTAALAHMSEHGASPGQASALIYMLTEAEKRAEEADSRRASLVTRLMNALGNPDAAPSTDDDIVAAARLLLERAQSEPVRVRALLQKFKTEVSAGIDVELRRLEASIDQHVKERARLQPLAAAAESFAVAFAKWGSAADSAPLKRAAIEAFAKDPTCAT